MIDAEHAGQLDPQSLAAQSVGVSVVDRGQLPLNVLLLNECQMSHLPYDATNDDISAFIDEWVTLLEAEDYDRAFAFTAHSAGSTLTPTSFRDHIKQQAAFHAQSFDETYGTLDPQCRVTLHGVPTHMTQVKDVDRWPKNTRGQVGEVWYNLNFDGFVTEYTALFEIVDDGSGLTIALLDIGVR